METSTREMVFADINAEYETALAEAKKVYETKLALAEKLFGVSIAGIVRPGRKPGKEGAVAYTREAVRLLSGEFMRGDVIQKIQELHPANNIPPKSITMVLVMLRKRGEIHATGRQVDGKMPKYRYGPAPEGNSPQPERPEATRQRFSKIKINPKKEDISSNGK